MRGGPELRDTKIATSTFSSIVDGGVILPGISSEKIVRKHGLNYPRNTVTNFRSNSFPQGAQNFLLDDRVLVFHQRESRYDPLSSCLVDYRGRATAPSVKNFQLLKSPPEDKCVRAGDEVCSKSLGGPKLPG